MIRKFSFVVDFSFNLFLFLTENFELFYSDFLLHFFRFFREFSFLIIQPLAVIDNLMKMKTE